jgi:S-formylglutathione hydrolase FrmB
MLVSKYISIAILLTLACGSAAPEKIIRPDVKPGKWLRNVRVSYQLDKATHQGIVQIYFPKKYNGAAGTRTLIVLHGYRQNPSDWENGTHISEYADTYGFVLVCPAMTTTLYESEYFPETVNTWAPMPGGVYITKVLVGFLRKNFGLAGDRKLTGIFGVSTGARGAILLAAQHPDLFGAAAGLSGDYDSVSIKNDRLLISVYGSYDAHRDRWEKEANILKMASSLDRTPVFLGHGTLDAVVPPPQTKMLADRLKELAGGTNRYECVVDLVKSNGAGHDWKYWGSLVPDVLKFFDGRLGK